MAKSFICKAFLTKDSSYSAVNDSKSRLNKTLSRIQHILDWERPQDDATSVDLLAQSILNGPNDSTDKENASFKESVREQRSTTLGDRTPPPPGPSESENLNRNAGEAARWESRFRTRETVKKKSTVGDCGCGTGAAPIPTERNVKAAHRHQNGGGRDHHPKIISSTVTNTRDFLDSEAVECCDRHSSLYRNSLSKCCDKHATTNHVPTSSWRHKNLGTGLENIEDAMNWRHRANRRQINTNPNGDRNPRNNNNKSMANANNTLESICFQCAGYINGGVDTKTPQRRKRIRLSGPLEQEEAEEEEEEQEQEVDHMTRGRTSIAETKLQEELLTGNLTDDQWASMALPSLQDSLVSGYDEEEEEEDVIAQLDGMAELPFDASVSKRSILLTPTEHDCRERETHTQRRANSIGSSQPTSLATHQLHGQRISGGNLKRVSNVRWEVPVRREKSLADEYMCTAQTVDADDYSRMLQNQAIVVCSFEAENKFLKDGLRSVRRSLEIVLSENEQLHRCLKRKLVDIVIESSSDDHNYQQRRRNENFVVATANESHFADQDTKTSCLSRTLRAYDFAKVKQQLETIIRLHKTRIDKLNAQLKLSRSETHRFEGEVVELQRKLSRELSLRSVSEAIQTFTVGFCVECGVRPATVVPPSTANSSSALAQLSKDRDDLFEKLLAEKSVCSELMDRERKLFADLSSAVADYEGAQLEVLEALKQREELKEELNRILALKGGELQALKSDLKQKLESETVCLEDSNCKLRAKVDELLGELEIQKEKLNRILKDKEILVENLDSAEKRLKTTEANRFKEGDDMTSLMKQALRQRDDARNQCGILRHQLMIERGTRVQKCIDDISSDAKLEKVKSLESEVRLKLDQMEKFYVEAVECRNEALREKTKEMDRLKKKYRRLKHHFQDSRAKHKAVVQPNNGSSAEPPEGEKPRGQLAPPLA